MTINCENQTVSIAGETPIFRTASSVRRLKCVDRIIGRLNVFYALYEICAAGRSYYTVAATDDITAVFKCIDGLDDGLACYDLVSENEVDTATFCDVINDYFTEKEYNRML